MPFSDPRFGKPVECPCGLVRRQRLARIDRDFGFEGYLRAKRISDVLHIQGAEDAIEAVRGFIADPRCWLYLWGPYGDGKTSLLAVAINELRAKGAEAIFVVAPELLDHLRKTFRPEAGQSFDEVFDYVRNVPVLGVDEVSGEKPSDWATEKLFELFDWRYRLRLTTIVTSNCHPDKLRDGRLASRFSDVDLGRVVHCGKHDVRRHKR